MLSLSQKNRLHDIRRQSPQRNLHVRVLVVDLFTGIKDLDQLPLQVLQMKALEKVTHSAHGRVERADNPGICPPEFKESASIPDEVRLPLSARKYAKENRGKSTGQRFTHDECSPPRQRCGTASPPQGARAVGTSCGTGPAQRGQKRRQRYKGPWTSRRRDASRKVLQHAVQLLASS